MRFGIVSFSPPNTCPIESVPFSHHTSALMTRMRIIPPLWGGLTSDLELSTSSANSLRKGRLIDSGGRSLLRLSNYEPGRRGDCLAGTNRLCPHASLSAEVLAAGPAAPSARPVRQIKDGKLWPNIELIKKLINVCETVAGEDDEPFGEKNNNI